MDNNQSKLIELLREVHVLAFKEIEWLNLRIAELESQSRQAAPKPVVATPAQGGQSLPKQPSAMLNERELADYLNRSSGL